MATRTATGTGTGTGTGTTTGTGTGTTTGTATGTTSSLEIYRFCIQHRVPIDPPLRPCKSKLFDRVPSLVLAVSAKLFHVSFLNIACERQGEDGHQHEEGTRMCG